MPESDRVPQGMLRVNCSGSRFGALVFVGLLGLLAFLAIVVCRSWSVFASWHHVVVKQMLSDLSNDSEGPAKVLSQLAKCDISCADTSVVWMVLLETPDCPSKVRILRKLLIKTSSEFSRWPAWNYPACSDLPDVRRDACQGSPDLTKLKESIAAYLSSDDVQLRTISALAVASLTPTDERILPILVRACALPGALSASDRYDCASALGVLDRGNALAQRELVLLLESDVASLRADAVIELGMLGAVESNSRISELLNDPDEWVRLMCIQTLSQLGCRRDVAVRSMLPCLLRGESERTSAVIALNSICRGSWRNDLLLLIDMRYPDTIGMAALALQKVYGLDSIAFKKLESLAIDESVSLKNRLLLIRALARVKDNPEVERLLQSLSRDKESVIRSLVIEIMAK
jgi:hypothetical protein